MKIKLNNNSRTIRAFVLISLILSSLLFVLYVIRYDTPRLDDELAAQDELEFSNYIVEGNAYLKLENYNNLAETERYGVIKDVGELEAFWNKLYVSAYLPTQRVEGIGAGKEELMPDIDFHSQTLIWIIDKYGGSSNAKISNILENSDGITVVIQPYVSDYGASGNVHFYVFDKTWKDINFEIEDTVRECDLYGNPGEECILG